MLKGQEEFGEPSRSGRGQAVADVGFDRPQNASGRLRLGIGPEGFEALEFFSIANRSACGVAFNGVYLLWNQA